MTKKNVIGNRADGVIELDGDKQMNVGHADDAKGACAVEVPKCGASRHELVEAVKFLERARIEIEYCQFVSMMIKSPEWRQRGLIALQIQEFASLHGDDVVNDALMEVRAEFRAMVPPEHWEVFTSDAARAFRRLQDDLVRRLPGRINEIEVAPSILH